MINKLIKKQSEIINLQVLLLIGMTLIITGITCNYTAIKNNEGRMPVLVEGNYEYKTKTHISYVEQNEVEYPFFSDRFHFLHYNYSIGDAFLIIFGAMGIILCGLLFVKVGQIEKLKIK